VQALDKAVGLRAFDPGGAVLDVLELEEQLVGMLVRPAAELAAVVAEDRGDPGLVLFEGRQHVGVEQVHGGDRHLVGIEPGPGVAREAVDGGLQIDLSHPLQAADEEGVDGDQVAGMAGLDVALAELRAEALQQADLLLRERDLALGGGLLQAQQALVAGQQAVAAPHPAHPAGGDLHAPQHQLLGDPQGAVAGMLQTVVEDGLLDLGRHPVGVRTSGAGQPVDEASAP
jgi:hypothetical protein